jgi:hypothetical protein
MQVCDSLDDAVTSAWCDLDSGEASPHSIEVPAAGRSYSGEELDALIDARCERMMRDAAPSPPSPPVIQVQGPNGVWVAPRSTKSEAELRALFGDARVRVVPS